MVNICLTSGAILIKQRQLIDGLKRFEMFDFWKCHKLTAALNGTSGEVPVSIRKWRDVNGKDVKGKDGFLANGRPCPWALLAPKMPMIFWMKGEEAALLEVKGQPEGTAGKDPRIPNCKC
jgi:hypothetical protein